MGLNWKDLGNGQWKLTITDDHGRVPPAYVTGTKDEILTKLATSKINGNVRINELKGAAQLTAGDRMKIVSDLQNPATAPEAITKVVETIVGSAAEFQQDREQERHERETRAAISTAQTFADSTPGWYPSEHNKRTLTEYMKRLGMEPNNLEHYRQAFAELSAANLLQPPPATRENDEEDDEGTTQTKPAAQTAEQTAPAPPKQPQAPTRYSTGLRSSDASGTQPRPTNRLKWTREQIDAMSTREYRTRMTDPDFVRAVEYYNQPKAQRRAS